MPDKPTFFKTAEEFRSWLQRNHDKKDELLVGFYKKSSRRPSITWPESVDQALCFGWIDGIRRRIDEDSYSIRFTPRRRGSIWSVVNIKRAGELMKQRLMHAAGVRAFEERDEAKSRAYSYEREAERLAPEYEQQFRANKKAWQYFENEAPCYRRLTMGWVMAAKKEETRARRLARLIDDSSHGRRIREVTLQPKT